LVLINIERENLVPNGEALRNETKLYFHNLSCLTIILEEPLAECKLINYARNPRVKSTRRLRAAQVAALRQSS
jgi:hypothetical protein